MKIPVSNWDLLFKAGQHVKVPQDARLVKSHMPFDTPAEAEPDLAAMPRERLPELIEPV